jgi:hypothetical protein
MKSPVGWNGVRWDGKTTFVLALEETDEAKALKKLLSEN